MAHLTNFPSLLFLLLFVSPICFLAGRTTAVNVVSLGADRTGKFGSTKAFRTAWTLVCRSRRPGTIQVPAGKYLLGAITFQGPCNNAAISFVINGTLLAPTNYQTLSSVGKWITFQNVAGVSIFGGKIDGRGSRLWACKLAKLSCPLGVNSINMVFVRGMVIRGLTSVNPQLFHLQIHGSTGVTLRGLTLVAPGNSPNTDGIHVQYSDRTTITGATIRTGDDCVSMGPGTTNAYIDGVACGPGHGISIGSLANNVNEPGVENITVKTVTMTGTQNGLRIKTWARPSNGFVKNVLYQNVVMKSVGYPIVIDQNYCPFLSGCPKQISGVKVSGVTYSNIRGTSTTQMAVKLDCSPANPCRGVKLEGISLTYGSQPAVSFCRNAKGTASGYVNPPSCL